jgi:hypothetical protein
LDFAYRTTNEHEHRVVAGAIIHGALVWQQLCRVDFGSSAPRFFAVPKRPDSNTSTTTTIITVSTFAG